MCNDTGANCYIYIFSEGRKVLHSLFPISPSPLPFPNSEFWRAGVEWGDFQLRPYARIDWPGVVRGIVTQDSNPHLLTGDRISLTYASRYIRIYPQFLGYDRKQVFRVNTDITSI